MTCPFPNLEQTAAGQLLAAPLWRGLDLGKPLPPSLHAVSVALPLWKHVVGYEEKQPEVISKLSCGYPRFVIHPLVRELAALVAKDRPALPFPSVRVAKRCVEFLARAAGAPAEVHPCQGAFVVTTNSSGEAALKSFWQHTGLIVSTREAQARLNGRAAAPDGDDACNSLRRHLAALYDCSPEDVFLQPTGMAAQLAALDALTARTPGCPTVQLGFPYVDTLKLQQKIGCGGILLHDLDHIEDELTRLLDSGRYAGAFGEIPGNPLLGSADLHRISPVLRSHRVPLVTDDVVATPLNVDLGPYADLIATSLTKFFVGTGEAMGGALICNPKSPFYAELKQAVAAGHEELLWQEDAAALEAQAASFPARMRQHNENGLLIAERLRRHPAVERVWYPKWEFRDAYEAVRRSDGGWGALVTFLPRQADRTSASIYDRLAVSKGPSLGTTFTLACPFTLLAHYTELDWAEACGVSRYLIRLSVGLEDPDDLWKRIETALH